MRENSGVALLPSTGIDWTIPDSVRRVWPSVARGSFAAIRAFKAKCREQSWCRWQSDRHLVKFLNNGLKLRNRARIADVQERKDRWFAAIGPALEYLRKHGTQRKAAYDLRTFGYRKPVIQEMLGLDFFVRAMADPVTGEVPTLDTDEARDLVTRQIEDILRERGWRVDMREECRDFVAEAIGTRTRGPGDVIMMDMTGWPIKVDGHVLEVVNPRTKQRERKYKKFIAALAVDACTGYTWIDQGYTDNELSQWPAFLRWMLLEQLRFRPRCMVMDRVSGVVESLLSANPDAPLPTIMPEVLLWIAAGVEIHVHTPKRATGKAHVERAAGLIKHRDLHAVSVRACLERHIQGDLRKPRSCVSHADALKLMAEVQQRANAHIISRDGGEVGRRDELWTCAEAAATKTPALVDNAGEIWRDIVSRTKIVRADGKLLTLFINGRKCIAELENFERAGIRRAAGSVAIVAPQGLCTGDDSTQFRACFVEQNASGLGLPRFHPFTVKVAARDRWGYDLAKPVYGEGYRAMPDTRGDEVKRQRTAIGKVWPAAVAALKEATTDESVDVYE